MESQFCQICKIFITKKNYSRHVGQLSHIHNMLNKKSVVRNSEEHRDNNVSVMYIFNCKYIIFF